MPVSIIEEHGKSITPAIEEVLIDLHISLAEAKVFIERFTVNGETSLLEQEWKRAASTSLPLFWDQFEAARDAVSKGPRRSDPMWKVTRWSVHNLEAFRSLTEKVESLITHLDTLTQPFKSLDRQYSIMVSEIRSIGPAQIEATTKALAPLSPSPVISKILEVLDDVSPSISASIASGFMKADDRTEAPAESLADASRTVTIDQSSPESFKKRSPDLCEACQTITLSMFVYGFRHALNYHQVLQSSGHCCFCRLLLDSYKKQKCFTLTGGRRCGKNHRGRLTWAIGTEGPGVRYGTFMLDCFHNGGVVAIATSEGTIFATSSLFWTRIY